MNIHTYPAIVLSARDYKDNDKLLTLFTIDKGVISAVIKGVRKSNAKLKFAANPFNFGNFTLSQNRGFFTVTGCEQLHDLSLDMAEPDKYLYGEIICELTELMVIEGDPETFNLMIRALKVMIYDGILPVLATLKYILHLWINSGYSKPVAEYKGQTLNTASGLFSYVAATEMEKLTNPADESLASSCLRRLLNAIQDKFAVTLKSLKYL